jgi:Acyl-CoA dehydrogenase, N-terminal domain.
LCRVGIGVAGMSKLVMTEEETMLADMARGFLDGAAPVSKLREMRDAGETHDAALWKEMADMGWAGVLVPEVAGGSGYGLCGGQCDRAGNGQDAGGLALYLDGCDCGDGATTCL